MLVPAALLVSVVLEYFFVSVVLLMLLLFCIYFCFCSCLFDQDESQKAFLLKPAKLGRVLDIISVIIFSSALLHVVFQHCCNNVSSYHSQFLLHWRCRHHNNVYKQAEVVVKVIFLLAIKLKVAVNYNGLVASFLYILQLKKNM